MTVCGWCIGAICAGIATLINPEEVLNQEMLAMELITFFVVQAVAGIMIAILPTILVYCLFSNQIVDGLTAGAVKG